MRSASGVFRTTRLAVFGTAMAIFLALAPAGHAACYPYELILDRTPVDLGGWTFDSVSIGECSSTIQMTQTPVDDHNAVAKFTGIGQGSRLDLAISYLRGREGYDLWDWTPANYGVHTWQDYKVSVATTRGQWICLGGVLSITNAGCSRPSWCGVDESSSNHIKFRIPTSVWQSHVTEEESPDGDMFISLDLETGTITLENTFLDVKIEPVWKPIPAAESLTIKHEVSTPETPFTSGMAFQYRFSPDYPHSFPPPQNLAWNDKNTLAPFTHSTFRQTYATQVQLRNSDHQAACGCYHYQDGFVFDYWEEATTPGTTVHKNTINNTIIFPVNYPLNTSKQLTAYWKKDIHATLDVDVHTLAETPPAQTVLVSSSAIAGGSVSATENATFWATTSYPTTFTATASAGYMFRHWEITGDPLSPETYRKTEPSFTADFPPLPEPLGPGEVYDVSVKAVFVSEELAELEELKKKVIEKLGPCLGLSTELGDPISPASGEFYETVTDMSVRSRGMDFAWTRIYHSRRGDVSAQGYGWDFGYNMFVRELDEDILFHDGTGRYDVYEDDDGDGLYAADGALDLVQREGTVVVFQDEQAIRHYFHPISVGSSISGKLDKIVDRNGNRILFTYSGGRLSAITDTQGRTYSIAYNSANRITSITDFSGRVVSYTYANSNLETVTGVDGGVTTYTYYSSANANLNHNLLTIKDPKQQVYLENVYGTTTTAESFDRVVSQRWGNVGEVYEISYENYRNTNPPPASPYGAARATTYEDRKDNQHTLYYDDENRLIVRDEGAARKTFYKYNANSLVTEIVYPEGNVERFVYEGGDHPIQRGNLSEYSAGIDGVDLSTEKYTYADNFSGCGCGGQFLKTLRNGKDHVTGFAYDANGNRTGIIQETHNTTYEYNVAGQVVAKNWPIDAAGYRRRDRFVYKPLTLTTPPFTTGGTGDLSDIYLDVNGQNIHVHIETDGRGNVVALTDGKGYTTSFDVDVKGRPTLVKHPEGVVVEVDYDLNGNVETLNTDRLTVTYGYDILNYLKTETKDGIGLLDPIITTYEYDKNRNLTKIIQPEGNTLQWAYDQHERVHEVRRGGVLTATATYDDNDNLLTWTRGTAGAAKTHTYSYDGHNRVQSMLDPAGTLTVFTYDVVSNLTEVTRGNEFRASFVYDTLDRLSSKIVENGASGDLVTTITYGGLDQVVTLLQTGSGATTYAYDTMRRLLKAQDAAGNFVTYAYDANGNVETLIRSEASDTAPVVLTDRYEYDGLNRPIEATDTASNTTTYGYDSHSNLASVLDAAGVLTSYEHDALDRLLEVALDVQGLGLTVSQEWDDNSRLATQTDGKGNTTAYDYDLLDRLETITYANGGVETYTYDVHDNVDTLLMPNGAAYDFSYDGLNRLIGRTVTKAGVPSDTATFTYDTLSRLLTANNGGARINYTYDLLGNVTSETLNDETLSAAYANATQMQRLTYPGNREIAYSYDTLGRLLKVHDGATTASPALATYTYRGPHRVKKRVLGNGVTTNYGFDARGFPTSAQHLSSTSSVLDSWGFSWDEVGSKTLREDLRTGGARRKHQYAYDGVRRLTGATHSAPSQSTATTAYSLDLAGNRTQVTGGPFAGAFTLTGTDDEVHQYTTSPFGVMDYDLNGNMTGVGAGFATRVSYEFDLLDRLVDVEQQVTGGWEVLSGTWGVDSDLLTNSNGGRIARRREGGFDKLRFDYRADHTLTSDNNDYILAAIRIGDSAESCLNYIGLTFRSTGTRLRKWVDGTAADLTSNTAVPAANTWYTLEIELDDAGDDIIVRTGPQGGTLTEVFRAPTTVGYFADMVMLGGGNLGGWSFNNMKTYAGGVLQQPVADGVIKTTYTYDALDRRIAKTVNEGVRPSETTRYFYYGWRVIEEQTGDGVTQLTYTHGNYIDETISMTRHVSPDTGQYFYLSDDLYNTTALTSSTGSVIERYDYDDYGHPSFYTNAGTTRTASAYGNNYLFNGREYDPRTQLYNYRHRHLSPALGRFITRDPIGIWGDAGNLGNPFIYVGNQPGKYVDPFGGQMEYPGFHHNGEPMLPPSPAQAWGAIQEAHRVLIGDPIRRLDPKPNGMTAALAEVVLVDRTDEVDIVVHSNNVIYTATQLLAAITPTAIFSKVKGLFGLAKAGRSGTGSQVDEVLEIYNKAVSIPDAQIIFNRHHPLPKFLGGDEIQILCRIDSKIHKEFHSDLTARLKRKSIPLNVGGRGGSSRDWALYMNANPGAQKTAFDAILESSRSMDAKHGTTITQSVWRSIYENAFTNYQGVP